MSKTLTGGFGVEDALGLAGLGLMAYGSWLAWAPLGFIVPGLMLTALATLRAAVAARAGGKAAK